MFYQLHRDDDDEDEVEASIGKSMVFNLWKEKELFFSLINKPDIPASVIEVLTL